MRVKYPRYISSCFWSYDVSTVDINKDKQFIVVQVLNYSDWRGVAWLFKFYSKSAIRKVVAHPSRGIWFRDVLNFWCQFFKIKLPKDVWERALFRVGPAEDMSIYKNVFD